MAAQDWELLERAKAYGSKVERVAATSIVGKSIPNDPSGDWKLQCKYKTVHVDLKDLPGRSKMMKLGHMQQENCNIIHEHIRKYGPWRRNVASDWEPLSLTERHLENEPATKRQTIMEAIPHAVPASARRITVPAANNSAPMRPNPPGPTKDSSWA